MNPKIFSVSEITRGIKNLLEENYSSLWISGEISNFKAHSSGHYYFSLKDENSQINAVMFKGSNRLFKFRLEDGLQVIVNGRVTVYEPRGSYQIVVEYIEPQGLGVLQLAFEQLKKKLETEGLFDESRKKALPLLPKKIGIVTSPTGAAIRDILHVLKRRYSNIEVLLAPVNVQGAEAAPAIVSAIEELNTFSDIDLIIVGRGGGSLEDLWAFNTEEIARAIAVSKIPVISAVGHEIDTTIADYVADLRAPTPSVAAELAVPVKDEIEIFVQSLKERLHEKIISKIEELRERSDFFKSHLTHPRKRLEELFQRLDELQDRLQLAFVSRLRCLLLEVKTLKKTLQALSPLAVLERGYSITYYQDKSGRKYPLKKVDSVPLNSEIETRLAQGNLWSKVIRKNQ